MKVYYDKDADLSLIKGKSDAKTTEENNALLLQPDDIVYVPERII